MKTWVNCFLLFICFGVQSQSLFVPDGFSNSGIGTSSNENIGIGVSNNTPIEKLDVTGNGKFSRVIAGGWDTPMISFNSKLYPEKKLYFDPSGAQKTYAVQMYLDNFTGHFYFRNDKSGIEETPVWQYPFVIFQSGNISIGDGLNQIKGAKLHVNGLTIIGDVPTDINTVTCNPKNKLYVNGTIATKEVKVSISNWCDYVFDEDYQLQTLGSLEHFIRTNKHLPEIPSEKEIVEKGVAVGEMMKIQMKKIEELTLYVIDLQKQNDIIRKELDMLKNKK